MATATAPSTKKPRNGPYSRAFSRGVISDTVHGSTRAGRFLRRCERELLAEIGVEPSFAQRLLVRRIARMMWRLELFDQKFDAGTMTDFDSKVFSALNSHVRLGLRELGPRHTPAPAPSTDEIAAAPAYDVTKMGGADFDRLFTYHAESFPKEVAEALKKAAEALRAREKVEWSPRRDRDGRQRRSSPQGAAHSIDGRGGRTHRA